MKRRTCVVAGVALAAGAGGAGLAWWRRSSSAPDLPAELWERRFETLDGNSLALADLRGRPLLVNFWATWCPPCIKELPEIERFYQVYRSKGWQVLGLAADRAEAVSSFLQGVHVSFPVAVAGLEGIQISRAFGNAAGALPFTVLLDTQGRVQQRRLGETSFDELSRWAARPV